RHHHRTRGHPPRTEPGIGDHLRGHRDRAPAGHRPRTDRHQRLLERADEGKPVAAEVTPMSSPTIQTDRLILRVPQAADFDGYCELMGDEQAARHIGGQMTRSAAWRKFLQMPGAWAVQGFGMFAALDRETGEWLGQAGPWQPEGWPGTEVG